MATKIEGGEQKKMDVNVIPDSAVDVSDTKQKKHQNQHHQQQQELRTSKMLLKKKTTMEKQLVGRGKRAEDGGERKEAAKKENDNTRNQKLRKEVEQQLKKSNDTDSRAIKAKDVEKEQKKKNITKKKPEMDAPGAPAAHRYQFRMRRAIDFCPVSSIWVRIFFYRSYVHLCIPLQYPCNSVIILDKRVLFLISLYLFLYSISVSSSQPRFFYFFECFRQSIDKSNHRTLLLLRFMGVSLDKYLETNVIQYLVVN